MARVAERLAAADSDIKLHQRLRWGECPVPRGWALRNTSNPMPELAEWVRAGLAAGRCMRTAQAEHIAQGHTLAHTAYTTGVASGEVLEVLTWAELPESE